MVGTGLTAVDATLSICSRGTESVVVAVSRSGLLPFAHLEQPLRPPVDPPSWVRPLTAEGVADAFRARCAEVELGGGDWRDVADAARPQVSSLWVELGVAEQRAFIDGYLRAWEIRRHCMAPQVAAQLAQLRQAGRFLPLGGSVVAIEEQGGRLQVDTFGPGGTQRHLVDHVVACVGPGLAINDSASPLVRQLLADGRAAADPHGLGLRADETGAVLDSRGEVGEALAVLGSLRRGELWETTAVPEIRVQAASIGAVAAVPRALTLTM